MSLLLSACSVVRMGYDRMPTISYWWLDSYLDFTDNQEEQVKSDLRELHQWHRSTQLPEYADILAGIGARTLGDASAVATCRDVEKVIAAVETFATHVTPHIARMTRQLSPAQLVHLRNTFAENDKTWRDKWINPTPEEVATTRYEDWLDRADSFYGDISDEQKAFMKLVIAHSVYDVKVGWDQRQRQQQDTLATLGKIVETSFSQSAAEAEIAGLLDRTLHPRDLVYLFMVQKVVLESCVNLAGLHQLTTQKQRLRAQEKLAGYEQDFRILSKE